MVASAWGWDPAGPGMGARASGALARGPQIVLYAAARSMRGVWASGNLCGRGNNSKHPASGVLDQRLLWRMSGLEE